MKEKKQRKKTIAEAWMTKDQEDGWANYRIAMPKEVIDEIERLMLEGFTDKVKISGGGNKK